MFGSTAETLSKASTMVFRIGTDAHLYDDPEDVSIAPLLDSKFDSEKCEALKRLLALIAQGFDVSNFFPQVVKNVASQSLEVKKLVYLYLLHYAEKRPSEALLSINCFQKDLGDPNPLVRACALRTMAGIRVNVIAPLVLVAVGKCARDPSVYVRKCAANALPKLHDLRQDENTSAIEEVVGMLLKDHSPGVVGAAAAAFASVCPNNLSLIGRNFKTLCEILPDVEEWGQIILIGILLRYVIARHGLVRESIMFSLHGARSSHFGKDDSDGFSITEKHSDEIGESYDYEIASMVSRCYIEGPDEYLSRSSYNKVLFEVSSEQFTSSKDNDDVKILLHCTSPLFWSNNSAVVLAAAAVHWIMAPKEDVKRIVKPLLFVLRSSSASKYVVLRNIQVFAKAMPSFFSPHFEDFFVSSSDPYQVKALKLEILSSIATDASALSIFKEFQDYVRDPDRQFAADTIAAIGLSAQRFPKMANTCIQGLLALVRQDFLTNNIDAGGGESVVLVQTIMSMKSIIKQDPPAYEKDIVQLVYALDSIRAPSARAMIIWILGEYCYLGDVIPRTLTTVLKYLAWCFTSEAPETKLQILNTTMKVLNCTKGDDLWTFKKLFKYILELAESDLNYDVRDRARFLKKFQSCCIGSQALADEADCGLQNNLLLPIVAEFILGRKTKLASHEQIDHRFYLPGSLSQIVLHAAPGYEPLPKPCSLLLDDLNVPERVDELGKSEISGDSYDRDDHGSFSESLDENVSDFSAQHSVTGSSGRDYSDETDSVSENGASVAPLIQISEAQNALESQNEASRSSPSDVGELMSNRTLESWLNEQHVSSDPSNSRGSHILNSSARISIGDLRSLVKQKIYSLLDPVMGNGLKVDYSFSSQISNISPLFICVEVSFKNCSSEPVVGIILAHEESDKTFNPTGHSKALLSADESLAADDSSLGSHGNVPAVIPTEEIATLNPDQVIQRILQVRFHHHLLPVKLALFFNDKNLPVKLRPDIGNFVKPLPMDIEAFMDKESRLPGMFEYTRSCTFTDHLVELNEEKTDNLFSKDSFLITCQSLALKMLQHINVCLVSVDMPVAGNLDDASGLCLRFSGEVLSSSLPCLITLVVEGKCRNPLSLTVKVNCEETVFGLNLLNRIVNFLSEPSN